MTRERASSSDTSRVIIAYYRGAVFHRLCVELLDRADHLLTLAGLFGSAPCFLRISS
jgi:hypothetical protein